MQALYNFYIVYDEVRSIQWQCAIYILVELVSSMQQVDYLCPKHNKILKY